MDNQAKNLDSAEKLLTAPLSLPCYQDWNGMIGDDRVRLCKRCNKNVYNVSQMSRDDAVALISEKEGNLCVLFYQRPDGSVITTDCFLFFIKDGVKPKYPVMRVLAWLNFIFAAYILYMVPLVGPAAITIIHTEGGYDGPYSYGDAPIVD